MFESVRGMAKDLWSNTDVENQTSSNSSRIWDYTQILLKGVGILAVGGVAYSIFRSLTTTSTGSYSTTEENALTISNEKSAVDIISVQSNFNIQSELQTSYQTSQDKLDITYRGRGKRDLGQVTDAILVTNETVYYQNGIAGLLDGGFVATWTNQINNTGYNQNFYAKFFSSSGTQLGGELLVTRSAVYELGLATSSSSNGDVVFAWVESNGAGSSNGIYAQSFASNGTILGNPFVVMANPNYEFPVIGALTNGGEFVLIALDYTGDFSGFNIYAQRFASNGTLLGPQISVLSNVLGDPGYNFIVGLTNGEFVVTTDNSSGSYYVNCYASNGTQLGNQTANVFAMSVIPSLADSEFLVLFDNSTGIYAQCFDNNCRTSGSEFLVKSNVGLYGATSFPGGQFVIGYVDSNNFYAQSFASNGMALGSEILVDSADGSIIGMTNLTNNQLAITWGSAGGSDIYAQIFTIGYGPPLLVQNTLNIDQGETVVLGAGDMVANSGGRTDVDNLLLLASNIEHGQFARTNQTNLPISNFTQGELINNLIQFTQDNSYFPPAYEIAVSDGFNLTAPQAVIVSFKSNPQFIYNNFTIADGKGINITANALLAVDYQNSEISFTVKNISHGTFATGGFNYTFSTRTTNFNQIQINASQILFFHDGSNVAPSYFIQASDGNLVSNYQAGNINFLYSSPSVSSSQTIGAAVGGVAGAALLAGLGIFGGYRYQKAKAYAEERANYPLANALYDALKIKGVDDFTSNKGLSFVNAVDALNNELVSAGISIQQMVPEELSELAERLAKAIKAQVSYKAGWGGIELNSLDIQDKAKQIVQTAQTLQTLGSSAKSDNKVIELTKF